MNKSKWITTGVIALALTGIGVGAANASTSTPAAPSSVVNTATPGEAGTETPGTETPGTGSAIDSDGPGGHQDADGVDVDHVGAAAEQ